MVVRRERNEREGKRTGTTERRKKNRRMVHRASENMAGTLRTCVGVHVQMQLYVWDGFGASKKDEEEENEG